MTPADRAVLLSALALAEGAQAAAADAVRELRRVLVETAASTPALREPEAQWVPIAEAARACRMTKDAVAQRARRGVTAGIAEKRGGRWYVRLDRMPAPGRGT